MTNQYLWIGISIAIFFAGFAGGYVISEQTYSPKNLMMNDPQTTTQWMSTMMDTMMNDQGLRQQMMNQMMGNPQFMQDLMNNDEMMNQNIMNQNMSFNEDAPLIMPMIDGFYNGNKVYFVHTEVSDSAMADMMSDMINFPTLHVPELKNIPEDQMAKIYVFTNGVPGSEPYGGGPFMYQIDVFDSIPGQAEYSQLRIPYLVTWSDDAQPRILTSESEILKSDSDGEITIVKSSLIVNAPMITWEMQGTNGKTMGKSSMIPRMFESMSEVEGELTLIDENNYVAIFKLHSEKEMNMKGMN